MTMPDLAEGVYTHAQYLAAHSLWTQIPGSEYEDKYVFDVSKLRPESKLAMLKTSLDVVVSEYNSVPGNLARMQAKVKAVAEHIKWFFLEYSINTKSLNIGLYAQNGEVIATYDPAYTPTIKVLMSWVIPAITLQALVDSGEFTGENDAFNMRASYGDELTLTYDVRLEYTEMAIEKRVFPALGPRLCQLLNFKESRQCSLIGA